MMKRPISSTYKQMGKTMPKMPSAKAGIKKGPVMKLGASPSWVKEAAAKMKKPASRAYLTPSRTVTKTRPRKVLGKG